ncbi:MAG: methionyl-tRNA formyltransferase [Thermodesulfobacteriota bacterium]
MSDSIKIIYMGTPEFAVAPLRVLLVEGIEVGCVVTQPVRGKGRGRKPAPSPVEAFASDEGIRVLTPLKVRDKSFIEELRAEEADFFVVVAYGKILPAEVLAIPEGGCVNLHASLLPQYRGAAPINRAIIDGAVETGLTTMLMDEGMDTGPMLLQESLTIGPDETAEELTKRLSAIGGGLLVETLLELSAGRLAARPQAEGLATYAPSMKKKDGLIDWTRTALEIKNLVRGVYPWPGAYTFRLGRVLKIHSVQAAPSEASGAGPGTIVRVEKDSFFVSTGDGFVEVLELQPENKRKMSAGDFIKGYKPEVGELLG